MKKDWTWEYYLNESEYSVWGSYTHVTSTFMNYFTSLREACRFVKKQKNIDKYEIMHVRSKIVIYSNIDDRGIPLKKYTPLKVWVDYTDNSTYLYDYKAPYKPWYVWGVEVQLKPEQFKALTDTQKKGVYRGKVVGVNSNVSGYRYILILRVSKKLKERQQPNK
jgi:hypothetical protein